MPPLQGPAANALAHTLALRVALASTCCRAMATTTLASSPCMAEAAQAENERRALEAWAKESLARRRELKGVLTADVAFRFAGTLSAARRHPLQAHWALPPLAPPGCHLAVATDPSPLESLGDDGYFTFGQPPEPFHKRRLFAGGKLRMRPIPVDTALRRVTTVKDVSVKEGRTGPLVFVTVRDEFVGDDGVPLVDELANVVFLRQDAKVDTGLGGGKPGDRVDLGAIPGAVVVRIRPDPVMLFRFSALTFNGHRIHYDQPYATTVEGYPGVLLHGPLCASLLMNHVLSAAAEANEAHGGNGAAHVLEFEYKAVRPLAVDRGGLVVPPGADAVAASRDLTLVAVPSPLGARDDGEAAGGGEWTCMALGATGAVAMTGRAVVSVKDGETTMPWAPW